MLMAQDNMQGYMQDRIRIAEVAYHYERIICEELNKWAIADVRKLVTDMERMIPDHGSTSPLRRQAADALRRARKLPVGADRNDLRQLAIGLLGLDKRAHAAEPSGHAMWHRAHC